MRCLTPEKPTRNVLLLLFVIFMQGMYAYIPETNRFTRVYNAAPVLWLLLLLHFMLFPMINALYFNISTSRSIRAVPSIALFFFL